jgi:glycine cleavage system H protein
MSIPTDCRYAKTHEWAKKEKDVIVVGITDFAQHELGDVVFVELPPSGSKLKKGEPFGVIESVKAASDLLTPFAGEVVVGNEAVVADPALINRDPHGAAWLIKVKPASPADFDALMDAKAYAAFIAGEAAKH